MIDEITKLEDLWNPQSAKLVAAGIVNEAWNEAMADWCEEMILEAKDKYYRGIVFIHDDVFNKIEARLELLRPTSKILEKVGSDEA